LAEADVPAPCAAYLLGNLCLPDDLVSRRLVPFPRPPRPGDLLAFPNTAGYFMDFSESQTLLQRTAAKVAVDRRAGRWSWSRDELFDPLVLLEGER
jgi:diaminopimelate decarboxylase